MNLIEKFEVDEDISIEILVPDLKNKFNYVYEPTEQLHVYDQLTVLFKIKNTVTTLGIDSTDFIVDVCKQSLEKALNNQIELPRHIDIGKFGYHYNINVMNEDSDLINCPNSVLWSSTEFITWCYNKDNKLYLEISPKYPWLYIDLEEAKLDEKFVSFEEYMKTYQPIFVGEIPKNVAEKWITQCDQILDTMIMVKP